MNSRRLWNSHQRHKFLRAEASGDVLKFRVAGIPHMVYAFNVTQNGNTDALQFYSMELIFC